MKRKYIYFIIILFIASSLAAFGRINGNDFIDFDDNIYIIENNHIKSGINPESIQWAFSTFESKNWHPLTWISLMLDYNLFGANPGGFHLINLFLHIGSAIFLFLFLNRTTKSPWPSVFAAALFALHPLRVESVAWAAERKDVLSMFFGMASVYAYALYAENLRLSRYVVCLILFITSLMSKSMLVTLPFVLLLLDYWPLNRWQRAFNNVYPSTKNETSLPVKRSGHLIDRLLWEKIPFIFLTIASSIITVWAQYEVGDIRPSIYFRLANAGISYVSYLGKIFLPIDLAVFYPFEYFFPSSQILFACLLFIIITMIVIYFIKKMPFLFVGWFWYVGTLVPVLGLVPINAPMADRYTYLPSIGIIIMLSWGIPALFYRKDIRKKILFPGGVLLLIILSVLTWKQCGYWKNSISLFSHALQVTKNNHLAFTNRGNTYNTTGHYQQAVDDFSEAIRIKPDYVGAYNNRGNALLNLGQYQRALEDYNQAIRLQYDYALAYNNRGIVYFVLGNKKQFCHDTQKACDFGECKLLEAAKKEGHCQ